MRQAIIAAAASEPEANEQGSYLIDRRLLYRGLQSLFLTKREELWLWANGRFRMHSGKFSMRSRLPCALQRISEEALITYYSRKYDLCMSLCSVCC